MNPVVTPARRVANIYRDTTRPQIIQPARSYKSKAIPLQFVAVYGGSALIVLALIFFAL